MKKLLRTFLLPVLLSIGCSSSTSIETVEETDGGIVKTTPDKKILIVDRTGKEWDVTHAVKTYNMKAEKFQYGLGPFAIRPIRNPRFFSPEDSGYPHSGNNLVIGTRLNGDARAYPIFIMKAFEIVNDSFGDTHVAVAY